MYPPDAKVNSSSTTSHLGHVPVKSLDSSTYLVKVADERKTSSRSARLYCPLGLVSSKADRAEQRSEASPGPVAGTHPRPSKPTLKQPPGLRYPAVCISTRSIDSPLDFGQASEQLCEKDIGRLDAITSKAKGPGENDERRLSPSLFLSLPA